jgi:glycosyltransferase involved in cell wall biosynthesis
VATAANPANGRRRLESRLGAPAEDGRGGAPRPQGACSPRVSVVIPTLNEAANLPHIFAEWPALVDEVVIVDGFSTDGTIRVAQALLPEAVIVRQARRGKGNALQHGFAMATGEIIVMFDADGSHDPSEIGRFVDALLAGADFAKGSRFLPDGGSSDITPLRRAGNRSLGMLVNILFGTRYSDLCYGYNAFWRHCLPVLDVDCDGFEVETLINIRIARSRFTIAEVPSFERDRIHGESNLNAYRDGWRILKTIIRERFLSPSRRAHQIETRTHQIETSKPALEAAD